MKENSEAGLGWLTLVVSVACVFVFFKAFGAL